jgi:hypothetical protein
VGAECSGRVTIPSGGHGAFDSPRHEGALPSVIGETVAPQCPGKRRPLHAVSPDMPYRGPGGCPRANLFEMWRGTSSHSRACARADPAVTTGTPPRIARTIAEPKRGTAPGDFAHRCPQRGSETADGQSASSLSQAGRIRQWIVHGWLQGWDWSSRRCGATPGLPAHMRPARSHQRREEIVVSAGQRSLDSGSSLIPSTRVSDEREACAQSQGAASASCETRHGRICFPTGGRVT